MRSLMMVIAPKHVGAVLMSILKLFLRQFTRASFGEQKTLIKGKSLSFPCPRHEAIKGEHKYNFSHS
jgi:hypothetical protein